MKKALSCVTPLIGRSIIQSTYFLGGLLSDAYHSNPSKFPSLYTANASSKWGGSAQNVFDPTKNTDFSTKYPPNVNQWIEVVFPTKVFISGYIIKTFSAGPGQSHLKSWILEGRNSQTESFTLLDTETDNSKLNGPLFESSFTCKKKHGIFRIIRLTQTKNWYPDTQLCLSNVDFNGIIKRKTPKGKYGFLNLMTLVSLISLIANDWSSWILRN